MNFRHYINDIEIEEPIGFHDFQQEIIRDEKERFIRYNFPIDLIFIGNGYEIIEQKYQLNYNSELTYKVIRDEHLELSAIIKMSNCEFNLTAKPKPSVNVQIDDNVFQAKIFNNKNRPNTVTALKTLNGIDLTPVPAIDLTTFNSVTGDDLTPIRKVYDIFEVLQHTISFISDGAITLVSDWYTNLPSDEKLAIATGAELRTPASAIQIQPPVVSFKDLFEELWKKYNLYFIVEDILTDSPFLRLEQESYLYGGAVILEMLGNDELTRSLDFDKLYNRVSLGSDSKKYFGNEFPMYFTNLVTFSEELYNIDGVIGVDNELDLVSDYIIGSNEIHEAVMNLSKSNDDKIFIIQYDSDTDKATKGDYFPSSNTANRFYNEQLTNLNVIQRFDYLGDVALGIGNLNASFRASQLTPYIGSVNLFAGINTPFFSNFPTPYDFQDDSTPPNFNNGDFDLSTDRYTATNAGVYRFEFEFRLKLTAVIDPTIIYSAFIRFRKNGASSLAPNQIIVKKYDSSGNIYSQFTTTQFDPIPAYLNVNESFVFKISYSMELGVGDYVEAYAQLFGMSPGGSSISYSIRDGLFSVPVTPLDGGVYEPGDPERYYIGLYNTPDQYIEQGEWEGMLSNPMGQVIIDTGNNDKRISYISKISRNIVSGESTVETIFNRDQAYK